MKRITIPVACYFIQCVLGNDFPSNPSLTVRSPAVNDLDKSYNYAILIRRGSHGSGKRTSLPPTKSGSKSESEGNKRQKTGNPAVTSPHSSQQRATTAQQEPGSPGVTSPRAGSLEPSGQAPSSPHGLSLPQLPSLGEWKPSSPRGRRSPSLDIVGAGPQDVKLSAIPPLQRTVINLPLPDLSFRPISPARSGSPGSSIPVGSPVALSNPQRIPFLASQRSPSPTRQQSQSPPALGPPTAKTAEASSASNIKKEAKAVAYGDGPAFLRSRLHQEGKGKPTVQYVPPGKSLGIEIQDPHSASVQAEMVEHPDYPSTKRRIGVATEGRNANYASKGGFYPRITKQIENSSKGFDEHLVSNSINSERRWAVPDNPDGTFGSSGARLQGGLGTLSAFVYGNDHAPKQSTSTPSSTPPKR